MLELSVWDDLLQTYVNGFGQVDYGRWQRESTSQLDSWLASVSALSLGALEPPETLALLLNLYNALTIQQVLRQYPIESIRPTLLGLPNWWAFWRFFTRPIYTLNGKRLGLNQIEHGLLRQQFSEPRIHFALVCASVGCPLLRNQAYRPEAVDRQLEDDARRFIQNPEKVRYDETSQTLYCSKIFKWYGQDFLKVAASVPDYIGSYLGLDLSPNQVEAVEFLPYDWSLNRQP